MGPSSVLEAVFQATSDWSGFPIDQVVALNPRHVSVTTRHLFSTTVGVAMGWICFGRQMLFLFGVLVVSYALLWLVPATVIQRYSMVWAMGCLSAAHLYRLMTDYGGYTLDFTGPLMVQVQKVTLVAYALHDGRARKKSDLNADQRLQKIHSVPSPLEYMSYMFNFQSVLAGPSCTFRQYLNFMDGSDLRQSLQISDNYAKGREQSEAHISEDKVHSEPPSPFLPTLSKLIYSLMCFVVFIILGKYYSINDILDPNYVGSLPSLLTTLPMVGLLIRIRYCFFWLLLDSVHNASGLGFSGYDSSGYPKWETVTNCKVLNIELGLNPRMVGVHGWNITTSKWLRRICYERVKGVDPNLMSFVLSAVWHGFYPGYYLMFLFFGVTNEAARKMRRLIRHHFQTSIFMKRLYDVITLLTTKFVVDFGSVPFILLSIDKGLLFWSYFYYIPVVIVCVVAFLFPSGKREGSGSTKDANTNKNPLGLNHFIQPPNRHNERETIYE